MGSLSKAALPAQRVYRSTWANRPANPQVGDVLNVTDIGRAGIGIELVWTGTKWVPRYGRQLIDHMTGTFANPLAVVSGVNVATRFGALEIGGIPHDLLNQGGIVVRGQSVVARNGSTAGVAPPVAGAGTATHDLRFGTAGTTADQTNGGQSWATGTLVASQQPRYYTDGVNRLIESSWNPEVGTSTSAALTAVAGPFPAGTYRLTPWMTPANTADGFRLLRFSCWLEG